jgi:hypothetical protein
MGALDRHTGNKAYRHYLFCSDSLVRLVLRDHDRAHTNALNLLHDRHALTYATTSCFELAFDTLLKKGHQHGLSLKARVIALDLLRGYRADDIVLLTRHIDCEWPERRAQLQILMQTYGLDRAEATVLLAVERDPVLSRLERLYVITSNLALKSAARSRHIDLIDPAEQSVPPQ